MVLVPWAAGLGSVHTQTGPPGVEAHVVVTPLPPQALAVLVEQEHPVCVDENVGVELGGQTSVPFCCWVALQAQPLPDVSEGLDRQNPPLLGIWQPGTTAPPVAPIQRGSEPPFVILSVRTASAPTPGSGIKASTNRKTTLLHLE